MLNSHALTTALENEYISGEIDEHESGFNRDSELIERIKNAPKIDPWNNLQDAYLTHNNAVRELRSRLKNYKAKVKLLESHLSLPIFQTLKP